MDRHGVAGPRGPQRLAGNRSRVAALPEREAQAGVGAVGVGDEEDLDPRQFVLGGGEDLDDPQAGGQIDAMVPLGLLAGDGIERKHVVVVGVAGRYPRVSAAARSGIRIS